MKILRNLLALKELRAWRRGPEAQSPDAQWLRKARTIRSRMERATSKKAK